MRQKIFILRSFCINMRKYTFKKRKNALFLSPLTRFLLSIGIPPILFSLLKAARELYAALPLTGAAAAYFGGMLEHHLAAIAILTVGAYAAERAARTMKS